MNMDQTTWRKLISKALEENGESWRSVVKCTLTDSKLDAGFDCGFGGVEGKPFTLWTQQRVYFPAQYDGSEWVESVPRNPCNEVTKHVGG